MIITVRGPIEDYSLGKTLVHEHILADFMATDITSCSKYDTRYVIEMVKPFLEDLKGFNFTGFIDCTPSYIGRDTILLRRLSEVLDIHILTNTGFYGAANDRYIPEFAYEESEERLADRWINEYTYGIGDTGVKPGFIKIGVDQGHLSNIDRKLVLASAITHLKTGLTIACHTGGGRSALDVLKVIKDSGVSPSALVIVHADSIEDKGIIFELAEEGCWIEFDSIGSRPIEFHLGLIGETLEKGFVSQLLLSQDAGWYRVEELGGGMGKFRAYTYIHRVLIPMLSRYIDGDIIDKIFEENPAKAFSITTRR